MEKSGKSERRKVVLSRKSKVTSGNPANPKNRGSDIFELSIPLCMDRRTRHKFERLKRTVKPQKADVFSIPVHSTQTFDGVISDEEASKETEVFTIHQSIAVKQAD